MLAFGERYTEHIAYLLVEFMVTAAASMARGYIGAWHELKLSPLYSGPHRCGGFFPVCTFS